jgi:hypothetical protein
VLYGLQWLRHLQTRDPIWRSHGFDRVTVAGRREGEQVSGPILSLLGTCYSDYESGPSLILLAEATGALIGPGYYGLHSCRRVP